MKKLRTVLCLLLCVLLALSLFAACGKGGNGSENGDKPGSAGAGLSAGTKTGDTVTMGKWNGEDITWTAVTAVVGKVLLLADSVLEVRPFSDAGRSSAPWGESDIRKWLNGEFYNGAFTEAEKEAIADSENVTRVVVTNEYGSKEYDYPVSAEKVFLLSLREYMRYVYPMGTLGYGVATKAVEEAGGMYLDPVENVPGVEKSARWMLRDDHYNNPFEGSCVYYDATGNSAGDDKDDKSGVRPAVWAYTDKAAAEAYLAGEAALPADAALDEKLAALQVGDKVTFGAFLPDVHTSKVWPYEDVTWTVVDEQDGKLMLLCDMLIDYQPFTQSETAESTWSASYLREYLNSDLFLNSVFTLWERSKLTKTPVEPAECSFPVERPLGEATEDLVFVLSAEEMQKYAENSMILEAREYYTGSYYWTRSPSFVEPFMACISTELGTSYDDEAYHSHGVRPAVWITP